MQGKPCAVRVVMKVTLSPIQTSLISHPKPSTPRQTISNSERGQGARPCFSRKCWVFWSVDYSRECAVIVQKQCIVVVVYRLTRVYMFCSADTELKNRARCTHALARPAGQVPSVNLTVKGTSHVLGLMINCLSRNQDEVSH